MSSSKYELQSWLKTLPNGDGVMIAIDDGGLTLVASDANGNFADDVIGGPYFELGGIPKDDDEPSDT